MRSIVTEQNPLMTLSLWWVAIVIFCSTNNQAKAARVSYQVSESSVEFEKSDDPNIPGQFEEVDLKVESHSNQPDESPVTGGSISKAIADTFGMFGSTLPGFSHSGARAWQPTFWPIHPVPTQRNININVLSNINLADFVRSFRENDEIDTKHLH